jgi:glycosyltransferase involved in cell wall biosynthesis
MKYPLVTFFIVSYNQEKYIAEAIDGAFAQDYPNLEIIISDDCSRDGTWDIIQTKANQYKGPHKVTINRNEPNIGPREHFNKVLYELSHGEIIVIAAGDDISRKDRVSRCVEVMDKNPNVASLSCVSQLIHEDGTPYEVSAVDSLSKGHLSVYTMWDYVGLSLMMSAGDSRVIRRKVLDSFPPLQWSYAEDVFLYIRSFYVGDVALIHEPLVQYRQHDSSIMGKQKKRKRITRADYDKYRNTDEKQIRADLDYAITKGYVALNQVEVVTTKIESVIEWLRPKKRTFIHKSIRKINKVFSRMCAKLDKVLP